MLIANTPPAPGFRDAGNNRGYGTLYAVGRSGFSWSSSISGSSGYYLDFNNSGLNPNVHNARAYGFPLRCLQE